MGDVKNTQLGLCVGRGFIYRLGFQELLQKAIILPLKMLMIFIMFPFPFLNSAIAVDPSRSINFKKKNWFAEFNLGAVLIVV